MLKMKHTELEFGWSNILMLNIYGILNKKNINLYLKELQKKSQKFIQFNKSY